MTDALRRDLRDLVDALPLGEVQAARRFLEFLVDGSDALSEIPDDERARLHASLRKAEVEIAAGQAVAADLVVRDLRASR